MGERESSVAALKVKSIPTIPVVSAPGIVPTAAAVMVVRSSAALVLSIGASIARVPASLVTVRATIRVRISSTGMVSRSVSV